MNRIDLICIGVLLRMRWDTIPLNGLCDWQALHSDIYIPPKHDMYINQNPLDGLIQVRKKIHCVFCYWFYRFQTPLSIAALMNFAKWKIWYIAYNARPKLQGSGN